MRTRSVSSAYFATGKGERERETYVINETATVKNTNATSEISPVKAEPRRLHSARKPAPKASTSKNRASRKKTQPKRHMYQ
jgi:hypothetical protein